MKVIKTWMLTLVCISAGVSSLSHASQIIYQWKDKYGELHFSDQPQEGAEKRVLHDAQAYQAPTVSLEKTKEITSQEKKKYSMAVISSPSDKSTIRNGTATVSASVSLKPELTLGDNIQFILDGQPVGKPQTELNFEFQNVFRGEHTVAAVVLDADNKKVIGTAPITVYMHPPLNNNGQTKNVIKVINRVSSLPLTQKVLG